MLTARSALGRGQSALAAGWRVRGAATSASVGGAGGGSEVRPPDWEKAKPYHEIPGPKPLPLLGNTWRFVFGPYREVSFLDIVKKLRKEYGNIVLLSKVFGRPDMVFVSDPHLVEHVLRNEGRYPIRRGINTVHYYRTVMRKDKYKAHIGTVTSQGETWYNFRSMVNTPMMKTTSVLEHIQPINEVTEDFIARMRELRDGNLELPKDFINDLYKWALESITMVALDTRLGCLEPNLSKDSEPQRLINAVHDVLDGMYKLDIRPSIWRYVSTPNWRRMVRALDFFASTSEKYINKALTERNESQRESVLLQLLKKGPEVANLMITDMISAGVDTTSHTVAAFLFFLAKNPDKQSKLHEELRKCLPDAKQPVTAKTIAEMRYLTACLRESLRMFPIAIGNSRTTPKDMVLGEYQIPKGTDVLLNHYLMSHDESHYPNPSQFVPERWLRGDEQAHKANPFVTLPFGFGPRMCIGRRFAELEIRILVAKVIRNFKVEYHYGDELQSEARTIHYVTSPLQFRLIDLK